MAWLGLAWLGWASKHSLSLRPLPLTPTPLYSPFFPSVLFSNIFSLTTFVLSLLPQITSVMYEAGEVLSKTAAAASPQHAQQWESWQEAAWQLLCDGAAAVCDHMSDQWNLIDVITLLCWSFWALCLHGLADPVSARVWLALSAIPLAFSLLRFLSIFKATGQLVITVFEMMKDMG